MRENRNVLVPKVTESSEEYFKHKTKVTFVIKKGHHISKKRKNTIPRTFEALCSLEMVCTDFFPTVDILRISMSDLALGRVLSL